MDRASLRSLERGVSPPTSGARARKRKRVQDPIRDETPLPKLQSTGSAFPTPAAIEAGQASVRDHLRYFSDQLTKFNRFDRDQSGKNSTSAEARTARDDHTTSHRRTICDYRDLYLRNANSRTGHHFVIHQHDHPRAGTHYDLRLQINEDSSCSWAIPYGLPGNANERRHGRRQGIETRYGAQVVLLHSDAAWANAYRIHSLWNHLIEAASWKTGSMLIWDTGEYEVLPFDKPKGNMTEDELSVASTDNEDREWSKFAALSQSEKLAAAFRLGKIRLKLHGTRLPPGYTISIRLSDKARAKVSGRADLTQPTAQRKKRQTKKKPSIALQPTDEDSEESRKLEVEGAPDMNSDGDDDREDAAIRTNNAYPGSRNTVGSIHQRWWFVSMDKTACGFVKQRDEDGHVLWVPGTERAKTRYPFFVRGRDGETSVVTGRKAADVLKDEGVEYYVFRAGWQPILQ